MATVVAILRILLRSSYNVDLKGYNEAVGTKHAMYTTTVFQAQEYFEPEMVMEHVKKESVMAQ